MERFSRRFSWARHLQGQNITERLSEDHQCYVLITCEKPQDGLMEVEYGGDPTLAAYLMENASVMIDEEVSCNHP